MGMCLAFPKFNLSGLRLPHLGWSRMMPPISSSDIWGVTVLQAASGCPLSIRSLRSSTPLVKEAATDQGKRLEDSCLSRTSVWPIAHSASSLLSAAPSHGVFEPQFSHPCNGDVGTDLLKLKERAQTTGPGRPDPMLRGCCGYCPHPPCGGPGPVQGN